MPSTTPMLMLAKRVPWARAWMVGQFLYKHGSDRLKNNLTDKERGELWNLSRKSKGQRSNLTSREQQRFIDLVRQAARGPRK
jgi:hypothetical protein